MASGKEIRSFHLEGARWVFSIRFSPDGKLVAATGDQLGPTPGWWDAYFVYVGEVASGRIVRRLGVWFGSRTGRTSGFDSLTFAARGKALVARTGGYLARRTESEVVLWDPVSGKELRRLPEVLCCAASADGRVLAGGKENGTIYLWDAATGREIRRWKGHRNAVRALAFSPHGKTLASGGGCYERADSREKTKVENDTAIQLWEVSTGKERVRCQGHAKPVRLVRFSPDGKALASESEDNLIVWDAATGAQKHRVAARGDAFYNHFGSAFTFGFSPDGKTLVWGHSEGGTIHHWDIGAGKEVRRWQTNQRWLTRLAFTPDGKTLVSGGDWLSVWDVATGTERHAQGGHRAGVCALKFSPDGRFVASLDEGHFLRAWEARTGLPLPLPDGRQGRVHRFGFSADGKTLAAVGFDAAVRVWELATGRQVVKYAVGTAATVREWEEITGYAQGHLSLKEHPDRCLVFGPGTGTLAVAGEDHHIHLWEVATGKKVARLDAGRGRLYSLAFSPGGNVLASVGADNTLRLWELPAGKEVHRFRDKEDSRILCCFSRDGKTFAWVGDETIHLWDLATRKEAGRLAGHPGGTAWIAFDRGGKTLVSGGRDHTVRLWDVGTRRERRVLTGGEGEFTSMELRPSPDGRVLVHLSMDFKHGRWSVREAATGREIATTDGWRERFTVSHDGKTFAQWSEEKGTVVFKETATGGDLGQLPAGHRGRAAVLAFSPDGKALATGGADTTVLVWDWERACGLAAPPPRRAGLPELEGLGEGLASTDSRQAYRAVAALAASGEEAARLRRGRADGAPAPGRPRQRRVPRPREGVSGAGEARGRGRAGLATGPGGSAVPGGPPARRAVAALPGPDPVVGPDAAPAAGRAGAGTGRDARGAASPSGAGPGDARSPADGGGPGGAGAAGPAAGGCSLTKDMPRALESRLQAVGDRLGPRTAQDRRPLESRL
jgi:WD40 repeat protein